MSTAVDKSLDALLPKIGGFGRYQAYIYVLVSITVILNGLVYLSFVFTARIVDFRCRIDECESKPPIYQDDWVKNAIPTRKGDEARQRPEKCNKYQLKEGVEATGKELCKNASHFDSDTEGCGDKYVFADETRTIMHEFNLMCGKDSVKKLAVVGTIQNAGQFIGLWSYGYVADRIGRRNMLVLGCILSGLTGIAKFIYIDYYTFVTFEFLDSVVGRGSYICSYVLIFMVTYNIIVGFLFLVTEIVSPQWRSFIGNTMGVVGACGQVLLAWLDYALKDWKWTTLVTHLPEFFIISYLWIMPESVRWQLVKGKTEPAKKTLRTLARVNRKELSEEELEVFDRIKAESSGMLSKSLLKTALRSKILMIRLLLYSYCWIVKNYIYYAITLNSVYITPNKYMDFSLTAAIDIPAFFLVGYVGQKFGRKWVMFGSYIFTSGIFVLFIFASNWAWPSWARLSLWLLGKFASGMISGVLYTWCTELFPTYLRQTFMGTISSVGRIGGMLAPLHPVLEEVWVPLPLIIYAAVAGSAGLVCLIFPETKNKKLPDTVKEAEEIKNAPTVV